MSKYGGYTLIAIAILVLIYRFDIIMETFKGTDHVPYYQLITPLVLILIGGFIIRFHIKKKKQKNEKDKTDSD